MKELFVSAVMAGLCIGLGTAASLTAPQPYLPALFFSIGLLYIRIRGFALLTGQNQYLFRGVSLRRWLVVLAGNFAGMAVMTAGLTAAYHLGMGSAAALAETAAGKFAGTPVSYFFPAVFCGCLMTAATHPTAPLWVSVLCVAAFILCGFRHSVADVFWLLEAGCRPNAVLGWIVIVLGNLAGGWLLGMGMKKT